MSRPNNSFGPYSNRPSAAGLAASMRRSSPKVTMASLPVARTEFVKGSRRTEVMFLANDKDPASLSGTGRP